LLSTAPADDAGQPREDGEGKGRTQDLRNCNMWVKNEEDPGESTN